MGSPALLMCDEKYFLSVRSFFGKTNDQEILEKLLGMLFFLLLLLLFLFVFLEFFFYFLLFSMLLFSYILFLQILKMRFLSSVGIKKKKKKKKKKLSPIQINTKKTIYLFLLRKTRFFLIIQK